MKPISRQTVHTIIGLLFVMSGGLGLVYQIVWFKYLSLFLGNTTYAQTIVLATFMGGLAIGAALWGRRADRTLQPLRLYALLEMGIGIYCLLYPKLLDLLENIFISIVASSQLPSDGSAVLLLKFLTSLCSLLLPTILMGGTLPVLVRFISQKMEESGRNIAVLYFLNSFGAVIGSVLAGFFFIRILGLGTTVYSAAIMNLLIGGYALLLSAKTPQSHKVGTQESPKSEHLFSRREIVLAIAVAGISGLAAMVYEVTWVRLLIPVLGSSTYSFSLMLVAFISGITVGSLIVSALVNRVKNLTSLLAWCQIGIVISMFAMLPLYARIPYEFWKVASTLARTESTYPIYLTIQFLFGFFLMIVPTIFLGMSLPVATRIAARGIDVLGKSVGNVFAVNTLGTVIGSLLAGLVLIPLVGVRHTIEFGIGCNLLAGLLVFIFAGSIPRRQAYVAVPAVFLVLILYSLFVPNWSQGSMLAGVFRRSNFSSTPPASYEEFVRQVSSEKVLYYKEGTTATIGVVESRYGNETQRALIVNGKPDASSKGDLPTQLLCGQLPCLVHKNPQNVLVVGLGSGVTVGSVLTHTVKRVDCVEIAPEIVEASSQFDEVNRRPFSDSRTNLYIEDALAYLKLTSRTYDIIINEPTNPWIAGVGNLFTTEFFETCKKRMNPGGIMVQWFHLYEMNDDLFKMVVRTFQSSFAYVSMWQPIDVDVIMLGSDQPISIDYEGMKAAMNAKDIREDIERISVSDAATLLSLEVLSPASIEKFAGFGNLNTEDHPRLEYSAPVAFFLSKGVTQLRQFDERLRSDSVGIELKRLVDNKRLKDEEIRNIGFLHTDRRPRYLQFGFSILRKLESKYPNDVELLERLAGIAELLGFREEALRHRKKLVELQPANPGTLEKYAWLKYVYEHQLATMMTPIDTKESEDLIRKCIKLTADTVDHFRFRLAEIYYGTQQYVKAADQYKRTIEIRSEYTPDPKIFDDFLFLKLAYCLERLGKKDGALGYAFQAANINPENVEVRDFIYEMWMRGKKPKK